MINILICDDNIEELGEICQAVRDYYGDNHFLAKFYDPQAALSYIEDGHEVDVAILDIVMPGMSGIELAEHFRRLGFIGYLIFLSISNDFAAQSYSVRAFSYILKPVNKQELSSLLDDLEKARTANNNASFTLRSKSRAQVIFFSELVYVEVNLHNLYFHLLNGEVIRIYASLKEYANILLIETRMAQCNKSFIVNMEHIKSLDRQSIIMKNGTRISISKTFSYFHDKCLKWLLGNVRTK